MHIGSTSKLETRQSPENRTGLQNFPVPIQKQQLTRTRKPFSPTDKTNTPNSGKDTSRARPGADCVRNLFAQQTPEGMRICNLISRRLANKTANV